MTIELSSTPRTLKTKHNQKFSKIRIIIYWMEIYIRICCHMARCFPSKLMIIDSIINKLNLVGMVICRHIWQILYKDMANPQSDNARQTILNGVHLEAKARVAPTFPTSTSVLVIIIAGAAIAGKISLFVHQTK